MKSLTLLIIIGFWLTGCQAQQATTSVAPDNAERREEFGTGDSSTSKAPRSSLAALALVEGLIKDPRIVERSWSQIQRSLPSGCQKTDDSPDVDCPHIDGVKRISVIALGHGVVDLELTFPLTCEDLRAVVVKRFGPAKKTAANGCSGDWNLQTFMKTGYLRLSKGKKDPAKVSLQFGVDQGP